MTPLRPFFLLLVLLPRLAAAQELDLAGSIREAREEEKAVARADELASPRATMQTFLVAMNALWDDPTAWRQAAACLEVEGRPEAEARELARQLYAVLNRIERVEVDSLPDAAAVSSRGIERYTWFPDRSRHARLLRRIGQPAGVIRLHRGSDGLWRFSAESLATLPALHEQLADLPLVAGRDLLTLGDWIEAHLPESLVRAEFLTVRLWQWIALFAVILLGLVVDLLTRSLLRLTSRRLSERFHGREDPEQLQRTLRPIGLTAAALVWLLALRIVDLQSTLALILGGALHVFLVISATLSVWHLIDLTAGIAMARAQGTATKIDDILVPLVTRAAKIFVLTMGIIYAADALDLPIAPLLASLTVAGVGFSFAAKDTVENFFGSVAVILDRPFDIGDWVVVGETEGIVEEVGFRSTRIRTFYNSQVTVPNANLVRASVDNYGRRRYRRWKTTLGVQYDTPPEKLVAFTEGIRELIRLHPMTRKDYYQVWCNEFGASSLEILLYLFFEVPDWNAELRERERLFLDIVRLANQLGVEFAFPTQTLHVFPGQGPAEPRPLPGPDTEPRAAQHGAQVAQRITAHQPWREG